MKIIHAADLHIDSPFQGPINGLGVLGEQPHLATRRAFHNLIELCLQQEAVVLLLAGDIFDGDCCDIATGEFFLDGLNRLQEVGTRVVLVYGNHDAECGVTRRLRLPDHVHRLATDRPETVVFEHLGVAVHGQSYARTAVWDNLARDYPPPLADLLNIGVLHTNAIGYAEIRCTRHAPLRNWLRKTMPIGRWAIYIGRRYSTRIPGWYIRAISRPDTCRKLDQRVVF